jgi:pimeloyl-ACP methyl ester carboxylesterase
VARWFVICHSLGAALVLNYAFDHPDDVIAQVFTNSASALGGLGWRAKIEASAADDAARLEAAGRAGLATNKLNPALSRRVVDDVRRELVADMDRLDPAGIAHAFRYTTPGTSIRERIMSNARPTLLVAGEREAAFDEGCDHAARAPHIEVHRVPVGHSPNAEAPDVFNALVVEFLARHTPDR